HRMNFWERVKKDLSLAIKEGADLVKQGTSSLRSEAKTFAQKGASSARKGADSVRNEAQRVASLGNLRYKLFRLNQDAQKIFTEIGGRVYEQAKDGETDISLDEKTTSLVEKAVKSETEIQGIKDKIKDLSRKKSAS
ncbi:MAG TPA: hypothetical protein VIU33_08470, partial [Nitrospiria bacterium]